MRKLIKICLSFISILLLGSIIAGKSYAALSCKVELQSPQTTYTKEDEFSVTVNITNLQPGKGIVTLGAVLDYDKTALELKEVAGENKWSVQIGGNQAKIIAFSGTKVTKDEAVMKLTFVVKKDTAAKSAWIKIQNFEISDGDEEITAQPTTLTLSIQDKQITPPTGDSSQNGNQGSTTTKPTTSNHNKKPTTTEQPVKEETDTSEAETTTINSVSNEETANSVQETEEEIEDLTQSTKVNQKKDNRWILLIAFGVVVLIVIAILGYSRRKKK